MLPAERERLLVLHALRIRGFADAGAVARRFALDRASVHELLLDEEARGVLTRVAFGDAGGWSLSDAGHREHAGLLAAELEETGARGAVTDLHAAFLRLNAGFLETITRWQIRPTPSDPMAGNDHDDWRWDERVLDRLAGHSRRLRPVGERLTEALPRFAGYAERFDAALDRVHRGQRRWVDEPAIDSCHTVWFELHEDLLATLGLERGEGG